MKKHVAIVVLVVFVAMSLCAVPVYAQDNIVDKVGDWAATRGLREPEKSMVLSQRKADRAAKRAEKELRKQSKKMEKGAKKMEKDMKDMFGR